MGILPQSAGVYIIHLHTPLSGHAEHYIGYSDNIARRFEEHATGQGARMLQVCVERGITFEVVRTFGIFGHSRNERNSIGRRKERELKNRKNARIMCPVCNPFSAENYPTKRRKPCKRKMYDGTDCPF